MYHSPLSPTADDEQVASCNGQHKLLVWASRAIAVCTAPEPAIPEMIDGYICIKPAGQSKLRICTGMYKILSSGRKLVAKLNKERQARGTTCTAVLVTEPAELQASEQAGSLREIERDPLRVKPSDQYIDLSPLPSDPTIKEL